MDRRRLLTLRPDPEALAPPPEPPPYAGGLAPYQPSASSPWTAQRAGHLWRRAAFGYDREAVAQIHDEGAAGAARRLVRDAVEAGEPRRPPWADLVRPPNSAPAAEREAYDQANRAGVREARESIVLEALGRRSGGSPLRERLALLWHSVLPVDAGQTGNRAHRTHEYWSVLRRNALGRYDAMVREVGLTQSMLLYLNGNQNRVGRPNENYARELLELFTMGIADLGGAPNYTQQDVTELSRALTGWTVPGGSLQAVFQERRFDDGDKTVFGVTGPLDYDGALDLVFSARRRPIAEYVAGRLYREFVHDVPNDRVVAELADVLDDADFVLEDAVGALLSSAHFFSDGVVGAKIRGAFEHQAGLLATLSPGDPAPHLARAFRNASEAGQAPLNPPDVSGWDGGRRWLDTSTLPTRWTGSDDLIGRSTLARDFVLALPDPFDPYAVVLDAARALLAVPVSDADGGQALEILLSGIPDYEWDPTAPTAPGRIRSMLRFLARLPEFQLT